MIEIPQTRTEAGVNETVQSDWRFVVDQEKDNKEGRQLDQSLVQPDVYGLAELYCFDMEMGRS